MVSILYMNPSVNVTSCGNCHAILEYDKGDIKNWTDSDGPGGCGSYYEYIKCPNCGASIDI